MSIINSAFSMSTTQNDELLLFFKTAVEIYRNPRCDSSMGEILEMGMEQWLSCPANDEDQRALDYVYGPQGHA